MKQTVATLLICFALRGVIANVFAVQAQRSAENAKNRCRLLLPPSTDLVNDITS